MKLYSRVILIHTQFILSSYPYGVNSPSLKCHLIYTKSPIHKFVLFCVQFTIPLQQLQSNGSVADLYSFNRLSRVFVTHPRDFLKNLWHFTGFYRTSLIVPPIVPCIRGENVWVIRQARGKLISKSQGWETFRRGRWF